MLVWRKVINLGDSAVGLSGADGARCSNWVSQGWLHRVMGPGLAVIMQLTPSWENGKYIVQNIHFSMQSLQVLVLSTPFHSIAWQILSNTVFKKTSAKSRLVLSSHKKVALTDCYWLFFSPMAKLPLLVYPFLSQREPNCYIFSVWIIYEVIVTWQLLTGTQSPTLAWHFEVGYNCRKLY